MVGLALFFVFLVVPFTEISLFILVGERIGLWPTLLICVATALLGAALVRYQGWGVMARAQAQAMDGKAPAMEIAEGVAILIAGLLLLTPGFFTDTIGFLLLAPPLRRMAISALGRRIGASFTFVNLGGGRGGGGSGGGRPPPGGPDAGDIIEGEVIDRDGDGAASAPPRSDSPWIPRDR
ncbi:MAG: FxsA family protein [Hyphomonadaceae bacterium]